MKYGIILNLILWPFYRIYTASFGRQKRPRQSNRDAHAEGRSHLQVVSDRKQSISRSGDQRFHQLCQNDSQHWSERFEHN